MTILTHMVILGSYADAPPGGPTYFFDRSMTRRYAVKDCVANVPPGNPINTRLPP